jgi:predicted transcriptional regulator
MEEVQTRNGLYGFEYLEHDKRRRPDDSQPRKWDAKQLWQRSHEIINLSARGFKNSEIAEILHISPVTVSNTLNGRLGQLKLSEIRQDRDGEAKKVVEKIRVLTGKALDVYHEIFDNESGEASLKDRKSAADTVVLELSGLRAPTKIQSHSMNVQLTRADLEEFKQRGLSAAQEAGLTIYVEPENEHSNQTSEEA